MTSLPDDRVQTTVYLPLREEIANSITHGFGLLLAIVGMLWLISISMEQGTVWHILGCTIYGITLVVLYAASTLYHGFQREKPKKFFRVADHVCIYLLIAGTYTPFALVQGGFWGWTILTLVWVFAGVGIFIKIAFSDRLDSMSYLPYVATGWLAVIAAKPIYDSYPMDVILWILAGGVFYSIGIYFVVKDNRSYFHTVWHLFVLAGSSCHFYAVVSYCSFSMA